MNMTLIKRLSGFSLLTPALAALVIGAPAMILPADGWAQAIEEIIVTTRKREENLQQVPIAIDVFTAAQIQRQGIVRLKKVVELSPSLQLQTGYSANDTQIVIRGLQPFRGRQNVAVLLDGVDITSESIGTFGGTMLLDPELFELERIEVVKGPQNALYGRSAFAGAISYVTKRPSDDFDADVMVDVGSDGIFRTSGRVSGPLVPEVLAGTLAGQYYTRDGFYDNIPTGAEVGGAEGYSLGGDLAWNATESLQFLAKLNYSDDEFEVLPWRFMDPNVNYPIPQSALDAGVFPAGFPVADPFGTPPATVAQMLNQPGILNLVDGFVPGPAGTFPDGDQPGATMGPDPRTCTDPTDGSTCTDYEDASREIVRAQLNIDWDLGPVTLTSLTAYADAEIQTFQDGNATGSSFDMPFLNEIRYTTDTELLSQELRLASNGEGPVGWTVGALYWDEEVDQVDNGNTCLNILHILAPNTGGFPGFGLPPRSNLPCGEFQADVGPQGTFAEANEVWFRDTEHWSAYFLVEWDISDRWSLDLEGRYVSEDLEVGGPDFDTIVDPIGLAHNRDTVGCVPWAGAAIPSFSCLNPRPVGITSGKQDDDFFVPKVTLSWTPTDSMMYYLSWAEAAKPAGIGALTGGPGAFDPDGQKFDREEKTTIELGGKTAWLDGALILNGAIFFDDYDEKQVSTQVVDPDSRLLIPQVTNASEAEIFGVELEIGWNATENLFLSAGYTYLDTEYTDFALLTTSPQDIAYSGNCTPFTDAGGNTVCSVDFSGNELQFAPENAFTSLVRYSRAINQNFDWYVEGDASYLDERFADFRNLLTLDDYWLANFRAGVVSDNWEFMAYVNNAFDDSTAKTGSDNIDLRYLAFDFGTSTVLVPNGARYLLPDPRTYGVRVTYNFGGG
jgi:outer membrane receptor protein involved in Fe transport